MLEAERFSFPGLRPGVRDGA